MANKRKTIGLIFTGNYNWVGGLYYILNIIKSIDYLSNEEQARIVVIHNRYTPQELIDQINFQYVKKVNISTISVFRRKAYSILRRLFNRNFLYEYIVKKNNIDYLYPFNSYLKEFRCIKCDVYYWIYDFQHKMLPEFFTDEEIEKRNVEFKKLSENADNIVLSSYDALGHFKMFYPNSKAKTHVLQFASLINTSNLPDFEYLKQKYKINIPYFIISNQFWQHKNHIVVLKAMKELKNTNHNINLVLTGKEYDFRNPDYYDSLINFAKKNKIDKNILSLGFIPREDQLGLMKNSIAVIQPSKFEGWGTVVEDAKTLGKKIILSDIPVHREQFGKHGFYFMPDDYIGLANILTNFSKNEKEVADNKRRFIKFASDFIEIFK